RFRLSGARAHWQPPETSAAMRLHERVARLWPGGLAVPSPDLPDRDPLLPLATAASAAAVLDTDGSFDPETVRPALVLWAPAPSATETYDRVVRMLAPMFADADIAWLDARLAHAAVTLP